MDRDAIELIRAVLPTGRSLYHDFQDRYAGLLLAHAVSPDGTAIAEVKRSHLAPLLRKPVVQGYLATLGRSTVYPDDFAALWGNAVDAYRLALTTWPRLTRKPDRARDQITGRGWSLVLQVNVSNEHVRTLDEHADGWESWNRPSAHPRAFGRELTLGWARLDIDLDRGEALVEEIQSDWVRNAPYIAERSASPGWARYVEQHLRPKAKRWAEVTLTAALWFLLEEIGVDVIFYHTHASGLRLKRIRYGAPPRSLYSDLPRRFCFRLTHNGPGFVRDSRDRGLRRLFSDPQTQWFVHNLSGA